MAGCGGDCTCAAKQPTGPRDRVTITDAIARVVVDNRVVVRALELHKLYGYEAEDIITQINLEKTEGLL